MKRLKHGKMEDRIPNPRTANFHLIIFNRKQALSKNP